MKIGCASIRRNLRFTEMMMIDIGSEELLSFAQAAGRYPGGPVHVGTLHRYRLRGVSGQRLKSVFVSGRWRTSMRAIERFVIAVNQKRSSVNAAISSLTASTGFLAAETNLERENL
jgi:hypothetical protein